MFVFGEKQKTVRVYDMDNEIISYQAPISDVLAENVVDTTIYLFVKTATSKATQTLKEKLNLDKLELFLRKKHYDVAFKFARNENFSKEVLSDISRYHGDFHYSKVLIS